MPTQNLNPDIMMMQPAKDWNCGNGAERHSTAEIRRILVQRKICPNLVVVRSVSLQDTAQVRFAEHDDVVERFATCVWRIADPGTKR